MAPPVFSVGQVLASADVNAWFVPAGAAYKTSALGRTSSTRSADPDLQITLPANGVFEVRASINWLAVAGVGITWTFTVPSGAGGSYQMSYSLNGAFGFTWTTVISAGSNGSPNYAAEMQGLITTTSSGTLGLQWASGTNGSTCTLGIGGILVASRVG